MDNLLKKTRLAVDKYHLKKAGDNMKETRTILSAVLACRKSVAESEREDRGGTQQLARQLSEVLSSLPMFTNFAADRKSLINIHTKKLADEHLDMIQQDLENALKEMQEGKKKKIQDWVKSHPVLGKLRKTAVKDLPPGAYILLFRRSASLPPKRRSGSKHNAGANNVSRNDSAVATLAAAETAGAEKDLSVQTVHFDSQEFNAELGGELMTSELLSGENALLDEHLTEEISMDTDEITMDTDENQELLNDGDDHFFAAEEGSQDELSLSIEAQDEESEAENQSPETQESPETHDSADSQSESVGSCEPDTKAPAQPGKKPGTAKVPPDLVVRPAADGKIFTRFRPKEFSDDTRLYRMFRGGPPLVGACIIAENKLLSAIGTLPQPNEGSDQLRLLLSLSKEAVGKPGRAFVEANPVLNELFQICKKRAIHKDAYILLFQRVEPVSSSIEQAAETPPTEMPGKSASKKTAVLRADSSELPEQNTQVENLDSPDSAQQEESDQTLPAEDTEDPAGRNNDELVSQADSALENPENKTDSQTNDLPDLCGEPETAQAGSPDESTQIELVSKKTEDGRIITRYRSFDFSDLRALYETFKKRQPIVGAAIIRERELIKVIGQVPAAEGTRQLDVLLGVSRLALEKPSIDFISSHPILNSLYGLANGDYRQKEYDVVLFTETEGRPEILSLPDKYGNKFPKAPLSEFRIPKLLHERFKSERPLIGASIISSDFSAGSGSREFSDRSGKDRNKDKGRDKDRDKGPRNENSFRGRSAPQRTPTVIAAFGRTPLKQNILLSVEILKRLGVDVSIL